MRLLLVRRVLQTRFGPEGDCFEACLASILDIPLADVPPYTEGNERMQTYFERKVDPWLAERGLALVAINVAHKVEQDGTADRLPDHLPPDLYWIASVGGGTNRTFNHAVVMRGPTLAHDPEGTLTNSSEFSDRIETVSFLAARRPRHSGRP